METDSPGFSGLAATIRHQRRISGLTQEALAERTGLSVRAIRDLETRRVQAPRAASLALLADALGIEPQALVALVVPAAERPGAAAAAGSLPPPPPPAVGLIGRQPLLTELQARLRSAMAARLCLAGLPGVGKSAVAASLAGRARPAFPDGVLWLDLRGFSRPVTAPDALRALIAALGPGRAGTDQDEQQLSARWAELVHTRRALVVLDNALDEAQLRPLLPPGGRCAFVVTARRPQMVVEPSAIVLVELMPPERATELLQAWVGPERLSAQPAATGRILAACGGLPLALRVASARLASRPRWSVADLADRLDDETGRLDQLRAGDLDVRATLMVAYASLRPGDRALLRALAAVGVPELPMWLVEALAGKPAGGAAAPVLDAVDRLIDDGLAQALGARGSDSSELIGLHDLVRIMAAEQACRPEHAEATATAIGRAVAAVGELADAADGAMLAQWASPGGPAWAHLSRVPACDQRVVPPPEVARAQRALEADQAAVAAVIERGIDLLDAATVWRPVVAVASCLQLAGRHKDWIALHERMLDRMAGGTDPLPVVVLRTSLASAHLDRGDMQRAEELYRVAADLARDTGVAEAVRYGELGSLIAQSYSTCPGGDSNSTVRRARRLLIDAEQAGEAWVAFEAAFTVGRLEGEVGRPAAALAVLERQAAGLAGQLPPLMAARLHHLAANQRIAIGDPVAFARAEEELRSAAETFADRGWTVWVAASLRSLARLQQATGRNAEALMTLQRCRETFDQLGDGRWVAYVDLAIARAHLELGAPAAARAGLEVARHELAELADARGLGLADELGADERLA